MLPCCRPAVTESTEGSRGHWCQPAAPVRAVAATRALQAESRPHGGRGQEAVYLSAEECQGEAPLMSVCVCVCVCGLLL